MKIYLADTIQREHLDYHDTLPINNHLESYWALLKQKTNTMDKGSICLNKKEEVTEEEVQEPGTSYHPEYPMIDIF